MKYTGDKRTDNKNARAMIQTIKDSGEYYSDIINSFEKQLKTKRTISEKQFNILVANLPVKI